MKFKLLDLTMEDPSSEQQKGGHSHLKEMAALYRLLTFTHQVSGFLLKF